MTRIVDIQRFQHEQLKDFREFLAIRNCENPEFQEKWNEFETVRREQFWSTAESFGLEYWEKLLELVPGASDTAETRRFRIATRLGQDTPYSPRGIVKNLEKTAGDGNVRMEINSSEQTAIFYLGLNALEHLAAVTEALHRMMPAHIYWEVRPLYNTHEHLNELELTHNDLDDYTHMDVREHYFG